MVKDFSSDQPAPQPDAATTRAPKDQGGEPMTGFVQAPGSDHAPFGPGDAIPPSTRTIH